jgi:hypothetical protein
MLKQILFLKVIPIFLIVSVLFTACDVPDISRFTEQSVEMTRGIKQGVKDTDTILADASKRSDLFNAGQIEQIKKQLIEYRKNTKITTKSLESIDAYLEALNTLAAANKKSGDNAKAVVNAVNGLVSAVSGITIADGAINLTTGIVTLVEKFRTAKAFKERVELVDQIMNGGDASGKPCVQDPHGEITQNEIDSIDNSVRQERERLENDLKTKSDNLNAEIKNLEIAKTQPTTEQQKEKLTAEINALIDEKEDAENDTKNKIFELYTKRAATLTISQKEQIEKAIGGLQCGIIAFQKRFTRRQKSSTEPFSSITTASSSKIQEFKKLFSKFSTTKQKLSYITI